jgi:hypothetical protein
MKNENIEINMNVCDLTIESLVPNVFENCVVAIFEDHHTLYMPTTMNGFVYEIWRKSRGGIFSNDVLAYTRKKPHGKYVLVNGYGDNFVARLIEEEELLVFEALNLIDGHLKDKPYMLLKKLSDQEPLSSSKRIIEDKVEQMHDMVMTMFIEPPEEEQSNYTSVSLFNDN